MPRKLTKQEVQELLLWYHSRGNVTRLAFCEAEGIARSTLGYYLGRRARPAVRLARVEITAESEVVGGRFALALRNGRRIDCGPADLAQLISAGERE